MPEGDVVLTTARRLHAALAGDVLTRCELRWGLLDSSPLLGRRTLEVVARGKHLLQRVEGGWTLHTHLRMEGSWRVVATPVLAPRTLANPALRVAVGTAAWTCLGIRLGMVDLVDSREEARLVGHLGPDVLGSDWDAETAVANILRQPQRPVAAALLDQRNLAGVGTIFMSESLFQERVHPWAPAGDAPMRRVVDRARALLRRSVAGLADGTGILREERWVHGRSGLPCRRCATPVRVSSVEVGGPEAPGMERVVFYCPACQGGLGPQDDGAPQAPLGARRRRPDQRGSR